jgi:hypothetical protein
VPQFYFQFKTEKQQGKRMTCEVEAAVGIF